MSLVRTLIALALLLLGAVVPVGASAQAASAPATASGAASAPAEAPGQGTQYTEKGADTCLYCHDQDADTLTFTTAGIFKNPHGHRANPNAPFGPGGLQCEACHGPGGRHATKGSDKKGTINNFKSSSFLTVSERNAYCLACHQNRSRTGWHAAAHERGALACTDCHQLHTDRDAVQTKADQPEVCFKCHKKQRADFQKASTHPVRFGLMVCSDCHSPHGSPSNAMLIKPTLNQTCYTCHADKRGPLLWEHAPVSEDCSLCHTAHGSVRSALLNQSPPLLCQQCHSQAGHPSIARTGAALPGGTAGGQIYLLAGSCTNCHSQVHGSNHPAGAKLMR
jgi:DmsE family decaheme c-type cytochrome